MSKVDHPEMRPSSDLDRFRRKVAGGDDQSRIFGPCGGQGQIPGPMMGSEVAEYIRAIFIACEALSERIAKLEERALKRKMK